MRLKLKHETRYTFETPARGVIQVLRLTPRNHAGQFVRRWRIEIDADCRLERDRDAYGNLCHTFSVDGVVDSLALVVEGEVDISDTFGVVSGTAERFAPGFWISATPLTACCPKISAYANAIAASEGGETLPFLHQLNARLYDDFTLEDDVARGATSAQEAFARKTGRYQDFAQVFIAAARARGLPARYVSGYFRRSDTDDQQPGHAWAEVHVEGIGWIGFDPTSGSCPDDRYLRLAIGRDHREAAPVRASHGDGEGETLDVAVEISASPTFSEQ